MRDFPARDIWFLPAVLQGSYQMGRVLGTSPSVVLLGGYRPPDRPACLSGQNEVMAAMGRKSTGSKVMATMGRKSTGSIRIFFPEIDRLTAYIKGLIPEILGPYDPYLDFLPENIGHAVQI